MDDRESLFGVLSRKCPGEKCESDSTTEIWHDSEESLSGANVSTNGSEDDDSRLQNTLRSKYYICDSQLHEKILEYLDLADLLSCRLVCHNWHNIIGGSGLLWRKCSMTFNRPRLRSIAGSYSKLDLIKKFHCPNFSFHCLDLRDEVYRNFFIIYGLELKYLRVHNCFLSKSTFDLMILQCPNLEHFQVNCIPRSVSLCEELFPLELHFTVKFTRLHTLVLERLDSKSADLRLGNNHSYNNNNEKILNSSAHPENCDGENLSCSFLQQLLESCTNLRRLKLSGWQGPTLYNLLNVINCRGQLFKSLKIIEFENICGKVDETHLFSFCSVNTDLKLEELRLSLREGEETNFQHNVKSCKNLDTVMEIALENYRESLRILQLRNFPVTSQLFQNEYPLLKKLTLINTLVRDIHSVLKVTPQLETIEYWSDSGQKKAGEDPINLRKEEMDEYFMNPFNLISQFHQCSACDLICLVTFATAITLVTITILVFQFEIYGQWFIFLGFIILVAICIADFYQHGEFVRD